MDTWAVYAANGGVIGLALSLFVGYLRWERNEIRRVNDRFDHYGEAPTSPTQSGGNTRQTLGQSVNRRRR